MVVQTVSHTNTFSVYNRRRQKQDKNVKQFVYFSYDAKQTRSRLELRVSKNKNTRTVFKCLFIIINAKP